MNGTVEKALHLWGLSGSEYRLIAARENQVFKVRTDDQSFALRLHRQGYRSDVELSSELQWMETVSIGGIKVPTPIPAQSGELLQIVDGTQVDVLDWLSGAPMAETVQALNSTQRVKLFNTIGIEMARLHLISDAWIQPDEFARCAWDRAGLLGNEPLWDCFWENPGLSAEDRKLFITMRAKAVMDLSQVEAHLDYGLIHADLVPANILVDDDRIQIIDFDDGGFGFRLFELATALAKFAFDDDFDELRIALINGYTRLREIDTNQLDLFIFLRSATYVGWNIARMDEQGASSRNERFIGEARQLALAYLSK